MVDKKKAIEIPGPGFLDIFSRVDNLLEINVKLLKQLLAQSSGQDAPAAPGIPGYVQGARGILRATSFKIFDKIRPVDATTTYYPGGQLPDCTEGVVNALIILVSSCNQALTIQTVGSISPQVTAENAFSIEAAQSLAANSSIGMGIDLTTNWYPFLGVSILTGATAPVTGVVDAWVWLRKQR